MLEETSQGNFDNPNAKDLGVELDTIAAQARTSFADGDPVYVITAAQYNKLCNVAAELQR